MQTKIHEPTQIVEVMLTHAEQADEAVKKQLKELYAQYKGTKYTVAVYQLREMGLHLHCAVLHHLRGIPADPSGIHHLLQLF